MRRELAGQSRTIGRHGTLRMPPATSDDGPLSIGVEEEFFLVDLEDGSPVPWADQLSASMPPVFRGGVAGELYPCTVELKTPVYHDLNELEISLGALRAETAARAAELGIGLLASSTHPDMPRGHMMLRNDSRYHRQSAEYRQLIVDQMVVGCHIHIGLESEEVIPVMNRVRSLLSPLVALSANSPFWYGTDTGYASWRTMVWTRWPVSGSPPRFLSHARYEAFVEEQVSTGVISDASNLYWDLRPSSRWPTLEFRAFDVGRTVEEVVTLVALVRACVRTVRDEEACGIPEVDVSRELLEAARWRAARDGLGGQLFDVVERRLKPAADVLSGLLEKLRPALQLEGAWDRVSRSVDEALHRGSGDQRQKMAFLRRGGMLDVVRDSTIRASSADATWSSRAGEDKRVLIATVGDGQELYGRGLAPGPRVPHREREPR